jgi:hypothetical protein
MEFCADKLDEHEYLSNTNVPSPQILKFQIEYARRSVADLDLRVTIDSQAESSAAAPTREARGAIGY